MSKFKNIFTINILTIIMCFMLQGLLVYVYIDLKSSIAQMGETIDNLYIK